MLSAVIRSVSSCFGSMSTSGEDESIHNPMHSAYADVTLSVPEHIRAIVPYQAGMTAATLSRATGIPEEKIIKLASNENPWGMSPKARQAIINAVSGIPRYPDEYALTAALAEHHQVASDQVVLTNGSDQLITAVAQAFLGPGRSAVMSQYAYLDYLRATQASGARAIEVPASEYDHDLPAMLAAITPDTRVVWLANPNNPTGSYIEPQEVSEFLNKIPRDVVVVLDEAYSDYLPPRLRADTRAWLGQLPNLVVSRTFSKIHGLAGLRMGYGLASPELANVLRSVRDTFACNSLALAAAHASIQDTGFIADCRRKNDEGLFQLEEGLQKLGLQTLPAYGNFVAVRLPEPDKIHQQLLSRGIIVRPLSQYRMPEFLRISVGLPAHNTAVLGALTDILCCGETPASPPRVQNPKNPIHPLHPAYYP